MHVGALALLTTHIRRRGEDRTETPTHPGKPRRWEKLAIIYEAMLHIVCAITVWEFVCLLE